MAIARLRLTTCRYFPSTIGHLHLLKRKLLDSLFKDKGGKFVAKFAAKNTPNSQLTKEVAIRYVFLKRSLNKYLVRKPPFPLIQLD